MINVVNAENTFNKVQYLLMIKDWKKPGIGGIYINIVKTMYDKPITNTIPANKREHFL